MSVYGEGAFWRATAERAVKTAAQTAVAVIGVGVTGLLAVDWAAVGSASGLAAILSVLTSIGSATIGANQGPSLSVEELPGKHAAQG